MTNGMRFLGLTKTQYVGVLVALVIMTFALHAFTIFQTESLAKQGANSHEALCVLKGDFAERVKQSEDFLALTRQQRIIGAGLQVSARQGWLPTETENSLAALFVHVCEMACSQIPHTGDES